MIEIDQKNDHQYRTIFIYKKYTLIMNMVLIFRERTDGGLYCTIRPEYAELYDLPKGTIMEVEIKTIKRPEVE